MDNFQQGLGAACKIGEGVGGVHLGLELAGEALAIAAQGQPPIGQVLGFGPQRGEGGILFLLEFAALDALLLALAIEGG